MDYRRFYKLLFAPLETQLGPIDPNTVFAIIGFDCGGPINLSTFGVDRGERVTTYVSCELAVRDEQIPSDVGRYEILCSCDDEQWVRRHVTNLGHMSLETQFGNGHTVDLGETVNLQDRLQGVIFEEVCSTCIDGRDYGILRVIGLTRAELEYKQEHGSMALIRMLKEGGVYPHTLTGRASLL